MPTNNQDQAQTLRRLFGQRGPERDAAGLEPTVLVVSGGSTGSGASPMLAELGVRLSRAKLRVLMIDRAGALERLAAVSASVTRAPNAMSELASGLSLLPASADPRAAATRARDFDVVLIDAGEGAGEGPLALHHPRFTSVVILTPDPASLADAYGLVKGLRNRRGITRASVIVNGVTDGREGQKAYQGLAAVSDRFLDIQLDYLGHRVHDEKNTQPVLISDFLINLDEEARSFSCLELLSKRIHSEFAERLLRVEDRSAARNMSGFWGTFTEVSK